MLVLTEPMAQDWRGTGPKASERAAISMGSPRRVPVPWASTRVMDAGVDAGGGVDAALEGGLGCGAGGGDAAGSAVLVDAGSGDDCVDAVVVADGVAEAFEDDDADAFAGDEAVGRVVEGVALAGWGGHAGVGEVEKHVGGDDVAGDPGGDGDGAFAGAEALAGEVEGDEGGGAAGVDGEGGALEVQQVGQAGGEDGQRGAEGGEGWGGCGGEVVAGGDADEDAAALAGEAGGGEAGVFDGVPGFLEEEALLGVHRLGFGGGDVEEEGVEGVVVFEEGGPFGVAAAWGGFRVEVGGHVEAGDFADGGAFVEDVLPEGVDVGGIGEAAGHADYGDVAGGLGGGFFLLRGVGSGGWQPTPGPSLKEGGGKAEPALASGKVSVMWRARASTVAKL